MRVRRLHGALLPFAAAMLLLGTAGAQPETAPGQGTITIHATPGSEASDSLDACQFHVKGHGVAGPTGAIVFLYAPGGPPYQPAHAPMNFTGRPNATGGYDFVAGPFTVPADDGSAEADLLFVNVTTATGWQEFTVEPSISCEGTPPTEVPFFATPAAMALGVVGVVGAAATLRRRRA